MKLLEQKCAGVAVVSRPDRDQSRTSSSDKPLPLVCEVTFDLSVSREEVGRGATEHFELTTTVQSEGRFADRVTVETAAARQLPDLFREIADELEKAGAKTRSG
ncbi:hypothetical protein EI545_04170 [Tabrizicola piscis]|uniref:Uncharacterized protein n=1 Tax=Tabrizicola piscis TaxID=2494374 RepID=A0A3S8U3A6_9RHOB|nr:hypothetical protein [Tabrizicola piscis]AZL58102.1 hypothetical protein EI545_04170 [Tabrizicola piscis]